MDNWSAGYVASTTTAMYGTSSTMYLGWDPTIQNPFPFPPGGFEDRPLTIFQNGFDQLRWVEMNNDQTGWTTPASIAGESSSLLPSVEVVDGIVTEVHVLYQGTADNVRRSIKSGSSWSSAVDLYRTIMSAPGYANIISNYSPTVEYHSSAGVEYLTTGEFVSGSPSYGNPKIYWRYTATNFTETSAPSITLGASSGEFNASFTPVAVDNNGNDKLYIFYLST